MFENHPSEKKKRQNKWNNAEFTSVVIMENVIVCANCKLCLCRTEDIDNENRNFYSTVESKLPFYKINLENNDIVCLVCKTTIGAKIENNILIRKSKTFMRTVFINEYIIIGGILRFLENNQYTESIDIHL